MSQNSESVQGKGRVRGVGGGRMKQYIDEIETKLASLPKRTSSQNPEAYIGGGQSRLKYIGLRVPDLRQTYRTGFSFSQNQPEEIAKIWDYVWQNSDCFETMALALLWFEDPKQRKNLKTHWPRLKKWSSRIDNWAHSDTLSGIYARIHEDSPADVYETLKKWNTSKNPWLRRLSLVSLLFYSSQRKKVPPLSKVTALLKPQLTFDHYYVQKGVGWTLREAGNVYPDAVYAFIEKNIHDISAHAFSAAAEKMSIKQRDHLKRLRKRSRVEKTR